MPLLFLSEDLTALRARREDVSRRHREAGAACGEASEQGESFAGHDNAPFEMAMQEKMLMANRLREIDALLSQAQVYEPKPNDGSVQFGRTVQVEDLGHGDVSWYTIGSPWSDREGDGSEQSPFRTSYQSPIARVLMGKKPLSVVELQAAKPARKLKIIEVR